MRVVDQLDPVDPDPGTGKAWSATKVYNTGDEVTHEGATYKAKWWTQGDNPSAGGPWELVSGTPTEPTPEPTPDPTPNPDPTPVPDTFIQWQAGVTQVANGDKVTHEGKCFVAKNGPGVWDTPTQSNWFWDEISCQ